MPIGPLAPTAISAETWLGESPTSNVEAFRRRDSWQITLRRRSIVFVSLSVARSKLDGYYLLAGRQAKLALASVPRT